MPFDDDDDAEDDDALISMARERRDAREEYRAPPCVVDAVVDTVVFMRADAVWRHTTHALVSTQVATHRRVKLSREKDDDAAF